MDTLCERTAVMKTTIQEKIGLIVCVFSVFLFASTVNAQISDAPYECDDNFGQCGTPEQSGGGCGCGGGGSILVNNTDLGDTYQYADDYDDDGLEDPFDNCPFIANPDQADDDGDGAGTGCDNCPSISNADQSDLDGDNIGDACDADMDGDGVPNGDDNCPENPNPPNPELQDDADGDGLGDACDDDMDGDGVVNLEDNCPLIANPDQSDEAPGQWGDACDADDDGDGVRNTYDNCRNIVNTDQSDIDEDGLGDACDPDADGDNIINPLDNCEFVYNPDQRDDDHDGLGEGNIDQGGEIAGCDDLFCYVVDGDQENCLNPEAAFAVYTPNAAGQTGDDIMLRLFANRINKPIRYTWEIVEAPSGSNATVDNAVGATNISTPFEYHYFLNEMVMLNPDKAGTYKIRLVAELVWEDEKSGVPDAQAEAYAIIEVDGEDINSESCSTAPLGRTNGRSMTALLPLLLLGLGLTVLRRR